MSTYKSSAKAKAELYIKDPAMGGDRAYAQGLIRSLLDENARLEKELKEAKEELEILQFAKDEFPDYLLNYLNKYRIYDPKAAQFIVKVVKDIQDEVYKLLESSSTTK